MRKLIDLKVKPRKLSKLISKIKNAKHIISVEGNKKCTTCDFTEDNLHLDECEQGIVCTHVFFSCRADCKIHANPLYNMRVDYNEFYEPDNNVGLASSDKNKKATKKKTVKTKKEQL